MIIEQGVKTLKVPILFFRESSDANLKPSRVWFTCDVTFTIWAEEEFQNDSLLLLLGRSGYGKEKMLKVYFQHEESLEELDFHSPRVGLTIKRGKETRLENDKVFELYKTRKYRILKEESGQLTLMPIAEFSRGD
ncbi:hypothetical protein MUP77_13750 [Candidatus Bathyarchaeota archaeon]|nr:hypothetical protein [Candidatus Bathyarchaeota archaeon]